MAHPGAGRPARISVSDARAPRRAVALLAALLSVVTAPLSASREPGLSIATRERALQPGEVVRVDIRSDEPLEAVHVAALGHTSGAHVVSDGVWRALIGIDLDVPPGEHTVQVDAATAGGVPVTGTVTLTVIPKEFPTRTLHVDPRFVTPPRRALARIRQEQERLARLFADASSPPAWDGRFVVPISGTMVSGFGVRSVFNHQPRAPHSGADFASPTGTPIHAPNAGRVVLAAALYYTGNTVVIDHGAGLVSLFAHLSRTLVKEGDQVTRGEVIGKVGATGRVTGPHLHWTVRLNGARVDPLSLVYATEDL